MLPEIALTTQIINRLRKHFGDKVGVYHSKFNKNERGEIWSEVLNGNRFPIILGTRSSIFLPYQNLGLIVVDEEHESSFKQKQKFHTITLEIPLLCTPIYLEQKYC